VTPTSQIVGTQAVLNVLTGERYKSISKETAGILKGEYGAAPAPFNKELQQRVLEGKDPVTCRPADLLEDEMSRLTAELKKLAGEKSIKLADAEVDDVLTYALFPQIGLKFLQNRGNAEAFEPVPTGEEETAAAKPAARPEGEPEVYTVTVGGQSYVVQVAEGGDVSAVTPAAAPATSGQAPAAAPSGGGEAVTAPLAGNIFKVNVKAGDTVQEGDVIVVLEAMKMETEVRAARSGTVGQVAVKPGDSVAVGDTLLTIA
ncbi:MAG: biotin/lipoyl-containing protein, partial [Ketobacteraceae bacterium]|nr:biotin/lipoyl-containing protein [Ketobacteraceae bacterium]